MLSLRYAIRSMHIDFVSALSALTIGKRDDGKESITVAFSAAATAGFPVVTKMNSLLFQALEEILKEESGKPKSQPSHGVSDKFINDLIIVEWPEAVNRNSYLDAGNGAMCDGKKLRKHMFMSGFKVGDVQMVPLLAGAGAAREGKYLFIREKLRSPILEKITLKLLKKKILPSR